MRPSQSHLLGLKPKHRSFYEENGPKVRDTDKTMGKWREKLKLENHKPQDIWGYLKLENSMEGRLRRLPWERSPPVLTSAFKVQSS